MAGKMTALEFEDALVSDIGEFWDDPFGFVMYAFPWGQKGTILEEHDGPDTWQREQLLRIGAAFKKDPETNIREAIASGHGIGKAQGYQARINTPTGVRRWGTLAPGDLVFGGDGAPTRITQCHHFKQVPMYRVTFDDRSTCEVSSGHLWSVRGRQERRKGLDTWQTLETIELLELGVKRPNGVAQARQWEIPIQGQAQFEERGVDIHPYFMGVWLGDGTRKQPMYTKPHPEVKAKVEACGYEIHTGIDRNTQQIQNITHLLTDPVFQKGSHERYIPDSYKYNTVENRMALFEGLCDTGGEVNNSGSIGYSTTGKRLAEDVLWFARSLGCKALMQPTTKHAFYPDPETGERVYCRDCYRVTINAPFNPFTIEHRKKAYKPSEERYLKRWVESIEPIEPEDGMCISVEAADGLYLANEFIVTHNSTEVSWIILWFMSTRAHCSGVVTANTTSQLTTKTWRELALWHKISINEHWFNWSATSFKHKKHPETWMVNAIPNTEHNSEAFAGLHAADVLVIMDEASAIPDKIFEVTEGSQTTSRACWFVFGNPTRNTGRFCDCFGTDKKRWHTTQIDSRTCKMTNKKEINEWVEVYGEDSDFVRVRVRGAFPRAGNMQFIASDTVDNCMAMELPLEAYIHMPVILSVDVARYGDDKSVITARQGRKVHEFRKFREHNTMQLAVQVVIAIKDYAPGIVFVDGVGVGGGVVDRLRQLGHEIFEINAGSKPQDTEIYYNLRVEMWDRMRQALRTGLDLPYDTDARKSLIGIEYGYDDKEKMRLERKKDMKKRGLESPDEGDSLAGTYAFEVGNLQKNSFEPEDEFEPEE